MTNSNTQTGISSIALKVILLVTKAIASSPTGVSFFSIKNYKNSFGEISDNLINIGVKYANAVVKDLEFLRNLDVTKLEGFKSSKLMLEKAKVELIQAFEKPNENRSNGQIDAYEYITDGIKVHKDTGVIYIWGFSVKKTVIEAGVYPVVKSRELTIAKDELRSLLKSSKYKQYAITVGNELSAKGETLEIEF